MSAMMLDSDIRELSYEEIDFVLGGGAVEAKGECTTTKSETKNADGSTTTTSTTTCTFSLKIG